ncbi:MAG: PH domain-containing protein [Lachnospiraceae bacterium]|nr:PH domain-containing protein [Lachnospiraceae bacterium]
MAQEENTVLWKDRKHWLWFPFSLTAYSIEDDRLIIKSGLLSTQVEETLLYRIVDLSCKQSLAGKLFGTGDIILKTKVDTTPEIILKNICAPFKIRTLISNAVEASRQKRNVVGKEFYGSGHAHMDEDGDGFCDFEEPLDH